MAALSGATGNITMPAGDLAVANVALITRWTASVDRDVHDISNFGTQTNERTKLGGMMDIKGTCEGTVDGAAMPLLTNMQTEDCVPGAGVVLTSTSGNAWTFDAILSNLSLDVPKGGVQTFSCAFESSGAIS